ncbi:hepatic leukemia factor-like isoform X2 [Panonychus citri]|nr:hepatic leukemia factor-like isoform X2 [Panonychus citri]XP_053206736.1 hepatic leukemia factor-like isoform X2 [Panonychus citri]XP_053206737.1 hepatic leukemia factor-like isoform X2 [Panonychus citri]XP_053206739.1 hepatic leukemia factor-like isoform X2 [Panonychus citri]XP_053210750.1 hepatic leukemia factor-like isoform X2 [Panonychus citri]XP_053210757.1 hepatic leukemia factor-like isoform X2 [Panonychus citri]XP_053210765.1 hepatic leukemia factor-like isoform X2 [Panonychus citr
MNLDEFLIENGVDYNYMNIIKEEQKINIEFSSLDIALATLPGSEASFDPSNARFSENELRPQPIMRKSRKQHVPDTLKDARYWARRSKNNMAAKRSREARRLKENQIVLRASYLEKENESLRLSLQNLRDENERLKKLLDSE